MNEYNANSIHIKTEQEATEDCIWLKANQLSTRYPSVAPESILIGLNACELSGMNVSLYEQRYLQGDRSVKVTPEFTEAYMTGVRENRKKLENR